MNNRETYGVVSVEGAIPGGLHFYWQDETGKHSFAEATIKQARNWAHDNAKESGTSDFFVSLATGIDEITTADAIRKLEALKEFRREVSTWFSRFCPIDRQLRIGLVIVRELSDCFISQLVKYMEKKPLKGLTIRWELESLPEDSSVYQMLLRVGKNEGAHNN